ncbi:hypothetical protein PM082_003253 [Marasmius tenuissimus]|nr:hypothetical protein PM082_003253 [Marasmius tenuissimus]
MIFGPKESMSGDDLPPLPPIRDTDLHLAVFTHSSISRGDEANDQWGDTGRLSVLGENAMEMTIARELFRHKPLLSKLAMEEQRANITNPENYDRWITSYKLDKKLGCSPGINPLETSEASTYDHSFLDYSL